MKQTNPIILIILFLSTHLFGQSESATKYNPETLSETPLYPIPTEMTFEEYQDMNRRMSQAVLLSTIPVPGITHYYAGEKKKARQLFYIGLGGLAGIIIGGSMMEKPQWPDTTGIGDNYEVYNSETEHETWYRKIPVSIEGGVTNYKLEKIEKEPNGSGGGLIALGILVIVGDFIYDRVWGFEKIEQKRDQVRFKYGQKMKLSFKPLIDPLAGKAGVALTLNF